MTVASVIIQAAYREGNLIPVGKQPTASELSEALDRLNRYVRGIFGFEMGEELTDWYVPVPQRTAPVAANYPQAPLATDVATGFSNPILADPGVSVYPYPPANSRLVFGGVTNTVYFPEAPNDGARMGVLQGSGAGDSATPGAVLTLDGNGRMIGNAATASFTWAALPSPTAPVEYMFRADLGQWIVFADMAQGDNMLFPNDFDDLFITALAIRLAPRYSKAVMPETTAMFKSMLLKFKARYRQKAVTTYKSTDIPNSRESYLPGNWLQ